MSFSSDDSMTVEQQKEREAVKRERAAYARGAREFGAADHSQFDPHGDFCKACRRYDESAAKAYPLPKLTRPRVVRDETGMSVTFWRVMDGCLQWRGEASPHRWIGTSPGESSMFVHVARVRLLAELIANPTEQYDSDSE